MNAKTKYSDEPLGDVEIVEDFLPGPAELAFEDEAVKVSDHLPVWAEFHAREWTAAGPVASRPSDVPR